MVESQEKEEKKWPGSFEKHRASLTESIDILRLCCEIMLRNLMFELVGKQRSAHSISQKSDRRVKRPRVDRGCHWKQRASGWKHLKTELWPLKKSGF